MPQTPPNGYAKGNPNCKGHRHFRGGVIHDGATECAARIASDEFPDVIGLGHTLQARSWYRIDRTQSHGTNVTYQFIGHGDDGPTQKPGNTKGPSA